jgi:hypothetical protein
MNYRKMIASEGYPLHHARNKLRDVPDEFYEQGHLFSFNREILCSMDVCGGCEAHAIMYAIQVGLAHTVEAAPRLEELRMNHREQDLTKNTNFMKCPKKFIV